MADTEGILSELKTVDQKVDRILEAVSSNATAIAETKRSIRALDDKLVGVQEALYFLAHKQLADREAEQLRSMLPDPPKRLASIEG